MRDDIHKEFPPQWLLERMDRIEAKQDVILSRPSEIDNKTP